MKKTNKREKGAALINVMLVVLLAVAIGLPLLYLVVVNFMFRMFDNNLRSLSYRNEIGMDNVYAIIQEIVIDEATDARDRAKEIVDAQVKNEQDAYKAWTSDGREIEVDTEDDDLDKLRSYMRDAGLNYEPFKYIYIANGEEIEDEILRELDRRKNEISLSSNGDETRYSYNNVIYRSLEQAKLAVERELDLEIRREDGVYQRWVASGRKVVTIENNLDSLKEYMYEYGCISIDEYNDEDFEVSFKYLDITDGSLNNEAIKIAYNDHFKIYYKENMDARNGTLEEKLKNKAHDNYRMKEEIEDIDEEQYALKTANYITYAPTADTTSIDTTVFYRGKSDSTKKYINSEVAATFTIGVPEFDSASSITQTTVQISNPLLDKTLVIGKSINVATEKNLSVTGNTTVSGGVIELGKDANMYVKGKLAVNGDINLAGGTSNSVKNTITTEGDVLCNEIRILGEYTDTNINGALYIADDMEFNKSNTNMVVDTLMGFNDIPNDSNKNSSVLFNDKEGVLSNVKLDIKNSAYIAGTAFLGDLGYKTGESTATRGNYRAYQSMMKDDVFTGDLAGYSLYRVSNMIFNNYGSISLVKNYIQDSLGNPNKEFDPNTGDMAVSHKTNYFVASFKAYKLIGNSAFLTSIPSIGDIPITAGEWKYSTGAYYDSKKDVNDRWQPPVGIGTEDGVIANAKKDYEKYTKYFGYGEGNKYRLIDGNDPTVVGENGWINSDNLEDAANKYSTFNPDDDIVVLVSKGDLTLTDDIDGKKGIIIASGDVYIDSDITFEGTLICGGNLIVNNNFTLINNTVAISKILESAISASEEEKALFKLFRDDGSGNMYTYSTINTQMASINMNELIKISNWKKSKFDI